MSHAYISLTFSVCSAQLPKDFLALEELKTFVEQVTKNSYTEQKNISHARDVGNASLVLYGSSRSGWFQDAIQNCAHVHKSSALEFLTYRHYDRRFESEHGDYYSVSVLDSVKIESASSEIVRLFEWAKQDPLSLAQQMSGLETMPDWNAQYKEEMHSFICETIVTAVKLDYLWAGICILGAVFFIFRAK